MNNNLKRMLLAGMAVGSFGWVAPGYGQISVEQRATSTGIETVVVTARRRAENAQSVPSTIVALSASDLKQRSVQTVYDLQYQTPGLALTTTNFGGSLDQNYSIRGQRQAGDGVAPGVVEYMAEVPIYSNEVAYSTYDLSSVQVLQGPQGTLFGRNTNGGAVIFAPRQPDTTFGGYLEGRYGNYNDEYLEAVINIPVDDTFSVRATGNIERRDGYTKNKSGPSADNLNYQTYRVSALWSPSSHFENLTVVNGGSADQVGPGFLPTHVVPCPPGGAFIATCFYTPAAVAAFKPLGINLVDYQAFANAQASRGPRLIDDPTPSTETEEMVGVANVSTLNLWGLTLKNILGYHDVQPHNVTDADGSADPVLILNVFKPAKQFTEEFQVLGKTFDDKFNYIAGVYYFKEDTAVDEPGNVLFYPFLYDPSYQAFYANKSTALYAQGTYDLSDFVQGLSFTGGLRYTWDTNSVREHNLNIFQPYNILGVPPGTAICIFNPGPGVDLANCNLKQTKPSSAPNWNLTLDYKPQNDLLLYVASHHGYKAGGFNVGAGDPGFISFLPETLTDVETGIKSQFEVGSVELQLDASGYYNWYTNIQRFGTVFINGLPSDIIQNKDPLEACSGPTAIEPHCLSSKAELYGANLGLTVVPFEGLVLSANYSYFHGKYTHYYFITGSGTIGDGTKLKFAGTPDNSLSLAGTYTLPVNSALGNMSISTDYSYRDGMFLGDDNNPYDIFPSFALLNARFDWQKVMGSSFDLGFFVKNATDKVYPVQYDPLGALGIHQQAYGPPRLFGVEATYHFGED